MLWMGTPTYMSPEQAKRSGQDVDARWATLSAKIALGGTPKGFAGYETS